MFYTNDQLKYLGLKSIGNNVLISDKASIYSPQNISIGNNVRIDDFCILSPSSELNIGNYIHISCYASIIGKGKVIIEDFVSISGRVSIYSSNDDYTGMGMANPMVPEEFRKVKDGDVTIKKHAIIGAGSVVLPNVIIEEGCAIGAMSLVRKNCKEFSIYAGCPAKKIGERNKNILNLEKELK